MEIIINTVIQYTAELIGLVLVSAIGLFGSWLLNKINQQKNLKNIELATSQLIYATQETVRRLQQTLVESYKEASPNGKLTPEQIEELKEKTLQITQEQLGAPIIDLLTAAKLDVGSMITNAAEAYINEMKNKDY